MPPPGGVRVSGLDTAPDANHNDVLKKPSVAPSAAASATAGRRLARSSGGRPKPAHRRSSSLSSGTVSAQRDQQRRYAEIGNWKNNRWVPSVERRARCTAGTLEPSAISTATDSRH